jgi:hypothetical protein
MNQLAPATNNKWKHKLRFRVSKDDELGVVAEPLLSLFRTYGLNPELLGNSQESGGKLIISIIFPTECELAQAVLLASDELAWPE